MKQVLALLCCILAIVVVSAASKGAGPSIGGFGWDYTGLAIREENRTQRHIVTEMEQSRREAERAETFKTIAIAVGVAAVAVTWIVQANRTERKKIDALAAAQAMPPPLQLASQAPPQQIAYYYINNLIPGGQGEVIDVQGVPMIADKARRQLVTMQEAERQLSERRLLPGPPHG